MAVGAQRRVGRNRTGLHCMQITCCFFLQCPLCPCARFLLAIPGVEGWGGGGKNLTGFEPVAPRAGTFMTKLAAGRPIGVHCKGSKSEGL